jgi:hypothetical protein
MTVPRGNATRTSMPPSAAVWLPPQVTDDGLNLRRRTSASHKRATTARSGSSSKRAISSDVISNIAAPSQAISSPSVRAAAADGCSTQPGGRCSVRWRAAASAKSNTISLAMRSSRCSTPRSTTHSHFEMQCLPIPRTREGCSGLKSKYIAQRFVMPVQRPDPRRQVRQAVAPACYRVTNHVCKHENVTHPGELHYQLEGVRDKCKKR